MVTFNSDYWAPAMDATVGRRPETSLFESDIPSNNNNNRNEERNKHLLHLPARVQRVGSFPSRLINRSKSSNSFRAPPSTNVLSAAAFDHSHLPLATLCPPQLIARQENYQSTTPSKYSFSQRLPGPTSQDTTRPSTQIENKSEDVAEGLKKSGLKDIFLPKIKRSVSSISISNRKHEPIVKTDTPMLKQYGVCEKGLIGRGASAVVRLARKTEGPKSELVYAVKEFRKRRKDESEKEYMKKLTTEFCISSSLHHDNIIRTVDLVKDESNHWFQIMEYCPGGDLYSIIKDTNMYPEEINCLFKQLIRGIVYLHSLGVAHRDIKPENLLMDEHGFLKITDFGVSDVFRICWERESHLSRGLCGSEPYIAPEVFNGKEYDATKSDIWACGIVYYTMNFHGIPFRTATLNDQNYKQFLSSRQDGKYEPFNRMTPGAKNLLNRVLEPDASNRISAQEILDDIWMFSIDVCCDNENSNHPRSSLHKHYCHAFQERLDNKRN